MKELSYIEKSLANLARLLGFNPDHYGWKTKLAEWFGVDTGMLSNWIKRGIPKARLESTVKRGYPPETWLVAPETGSGSTVAQGNGLTLVPPKPSHEDLIKQFHDRDLARELNEILLAIEEHDPEVLRRDVRGFLQGILTGLEAKKRGNDS